MPIGPDTVTDAELILLCMSDANPDASRGATARSSRAAAAMSSRPGVGPVLHQRLLTHFGGAEAVCAASVERLAAVEGMGALRSERLHRAVRLAQQQGVAARERARMRECSAVLVRRGDDDYPALLSLIADPPAALWMRGELRADDALAIAIVGARRCGAYGLAHTARLAGGLAERGFTIVSGGARGIDAEAHRAALRAGGRTVAVFGGGLGICYPPEHAELFERIAVSGALLSEMPCRTPPRPELFPRRNRIVSGLVLGVVVVEAADRSGALITARLAAEEHHREVMALPGSVDSPRSVGCHRAIREGWAALVTSVDEITTQLDGVRTLLHSALTATSAQSGSPPGCAVAPGVGVGPLERTGVAVPLPSPEDMAAMSTADAVVTAVSAREEGMTAAELADSLERDAAELMTAITLLRLCGRLVQDSSGRLRPGRPSCLAGARPVDGARQSGEHSQSACRPSDRQSIS